MGRRAYNLTDDVSLLVHLLAKRVDALSHLEPGRILHGISQARTRSRYGVYAQCHALRFRHGEREMVSEGYRWVWPVLRVRGQEIAYYITYFLPRFLDQPVRERLHTLLHELHHISPTFNGDLRRFQGRNEFHGNTRAEFDGVVDRVLESAERVIDLDRFPFLVHDFEGLVERYGGVVGNHLKRFNPRKMPIEQAVPAAPAISGHQRSLF